MVTTKGILGGNWKTVSGSDLLGPLAVVGLVGLVRLFGVVGLVEVAAGC